MSVSCNYHFRPFTVLNDLPEYKAYYVTLYCFFDGEKVHSFYDQQTMLDNLCFAKECGFDVSVFAKEIVVSMTSHRSIFLEIEKYVPQSDFNKKR